MERTRVRALIIVLTVLAFSAIVAACNTQPATPTPAAAPAMVSPIPPSEPMDGTPVTDDGSTFVDGSLAASPTPQPQSTVGAAADGVAATVAARTPVPTPTLGPIDRKINQVLDSAGMAGDTFLGLTAADWVNITISVLIALFGYFLGGRLLVYGLKWFVRRTDMTLDDKLLKKIGQELQWLVFLVFTRFAVMRLDFITGGLRRMLDDVFFVSELVVGTIIALKLVNFAVQTYMTNYVSKDEQVKLDAVLIMVRRIAYFLVLIIALSIAMDHFGFDVSVLTVVILVFGLIAGLGAKNMFSDIISGFIILVDQPFRVGDTILIANLKTSGKVENIGTRTTRIATGDRREVMVPNSQIGESEVVNYSHPDPNYRVQIDIGIAYGSDANQVHKVITDAVRSVEGVRPEDPVDVFFYKWGDSAKTTRVRWWIDSYSDQYPMLDKVNSAIEVALAKAGIDTPFDTYHLNVVEEDEGADKTTPAPSDNPPKATAS